MAVLHIHIVVLSFLREGDTKLDKMEWIEITEENKPDANIKIAFMTDHILFPDNTYFGIRSDATGNYYSNGQTFEKNMVTHYFYVEANGALAK